MTVHQDCARFTLDFTELQSMAAVALNRWAHTHSLSARLRISKELNISPRTVDNWIQGRTAIPQTTLAQLVLLVDEGFALELMKETAARGDYKMLARIFRSHIQTIQEPFNGSPRHCNQSDRRMPRGSSPLEMA